MNLIYSAFGFMVMTFMMTEVHGNVITPFGRYHSTIASPHTRAIHVALLCNFRRTSPGLCLSRYEISYLTCILPIFHWLHVWRQLCGWRMCCKWVWIVASSLARPFRVVSYWTLSFRLTHRVLNYTSAGFRLHASFRDNVFELKYTFVSIVWGRGWDGIYRTAKVRSWNKCYDDS